MEFEYDTSGDTTQVFIAGGLICYLIPATISRLTATASPPAEEKSLDQKVNLSSLCKSKNAKLSKESEAKQTRFPFWSVVYYLSWVVFAITVYGMSGLEHETFYDPHAILELSSDTTDMKVITKQYRKMTLDFHPDRCPANSKAETDELCAERFMKITKAKEALTDPEVMENIRKYGNPDGAQLKSFGIALPSWIVNPENAVHVLTMYFFIFMVVLPTVVGTWWYNRAKYYSDDVMLQTIRIFNMCLQDTVAIKVLIERMCWCDEFQQMQCKNEDVPALQRLHKEHVRLWPSDMPPVFKKLLQKIPQINPPLKQVPVIKSRILLHSHVAGMHEDIQREPGFQEALDACLSKGPALVDAMIEIAKYRQRVGLVKHIMQLSQMLVQGLDRRGYGPTGLQEAHLMQVPHFNSSTIKLCRNKKVKVNSIRELFTLDEETRNTQVLTKFSDDEREDVKRFGQAFPFLDVSAEVVVKGEEHAEVLTQSMVTIKVKLKRLSMEGVNSLGVCQTPKQALLEQINSAEDVEVDVKAKEEADALRYQQQKSKGKGGKKKPNKKKKAIVAAEPDASTNADADAVDAPAEGGADNAEPAKDALAPTKETSVDDSEDEESEDEDAAESSGGEEVDDEDDDDFVPPEFEDDGTDKAKLKEFKKRESYPVHCPKFPDQKDEWWWVFVGYGDGETLVSPDIKKVMTLKDEETVELPVRAPPRPGKYPLTVFVMSDSYINIDEEIVIELDVKQGKDEVEEDDEDDADDDFDSEFDDEDDESDADSDF